MQADILDPFLKVDNVRAINSALKERAEKTSYTSQIGQQKVWVNPVKQDDRRQWKQNPDFLTCWWLNNSILLKGELTGGKMEK